MSSWRMAVSSATALVALFSILSLSAVIADFSFTDWRYAKSIEIPTELAEGGLVEVKIDREVFPEAAEGLVDLRIIGGDDEEVAYQLVQETAKKRRETIPVNIQDLGFIPGEYSSFVVDLGTEGTLHNEIEIHTTTENFQRDVIVEGSRDSNIWAVLQDGTKIFDFTLDERNFTARNTHVRYPESAVRYLRVRVVNDGQEPLNITGASVSSVQESLAQVATYDASSITLSDDAETRTSLVVIDLGSRGLPTNQVSIETPSVNFYREVTLAGSDDGDVWRRLRSSGAVYAYNTPKFVGDQLSVTYAEVAYRYLRLTIDNEDNSPIVVEDVEISGTLRKLIFQAQRGDSYTLYYGNPDARSPSYDLERILPYLDTDKTTTGSLGAQRFNPKFATPRVPTSERYPWLITVAVGVAAIAVALLLFGVIRRAKSLLPPPN